MSKMDQTQFAKACSALASAWNNISESGQVYGICKDSGAGVYVQMDWGTMRELFPDSQVEFVERDSLEYRWEAQLIVDGVKVMALLTDKESSEAMNKEAE